MATTRGNIFDQIEIDLVRAGRLAVPFIVIAGWWLLSLLIGQSVLPSPLRTFTALVAGIQDGWIVSNLIITMSALVLAFVLAVISGLACGALLGLNEFIHDTFEIYILSAYAVPKIIFFPIFLFVFSLGFQMKVAYATLSGFFPMLIITMSAIRSIDEIYLEVSRSLRLTKWQQLRHIIIPFILVQLVVAIRFAFSLTFLGIILVGLIASKSGIGLILQQAMGSYNTVRIMVIVTVLIGIAGAVNILFYLCQRYLENRWNINAEVGGI